MTTAIVEFERIGRHHNIDPLVADYVDDDLDQLAIQVYRMARRYLASRNVEVHIDAADDTGQAGTVTIWCGFRPGGEGTFRVVITPEGATP